MKSAKFLAVTSFVFINCIFVPRCTQAEGTNAVAGADTTNAVAGEDETEELAKQAQNPVAKLISVPFQNNFNFGIGPNNVVQYNLNVQPVIPFNLNEDWNLITRTIIPI